MKHIIAATDFSENANNAASFAADLACRLRAHLNLLYVFQTVVPFTDGSMPPLYIEDAQEEGEKQLAELKEKLLIQTGERIIVHTEIQGGNFVNELNDYCHEITPYAVVVGTESKGMLERLALGGEAVSVLKHLTWPLIIVPPNKRFSDFKRIGLACDLEDVAESVRTKEIEDWVEEFDAELHVIHVNPSFDKPLTKIKAAESSWLRSILGDMSPKYHFPHRADLDDGIAEFAARLKLDLLIVIPKSRNWFESIFKTSKSKEIMLHTNIPILSLHE